MAEETKEQLLRKLGSKLKKDELASLLEAMSEEESQEPKREGRSSGATVSPTGRRVRVDVSGLPMLGVFAGPGATAAGTITGVDADAREVKVYLDACFDGEKEILVSPERVLFA
jgi:hypothetical protein